MTERKKDRGELWCKGNGKTYEIKWQKTKQNKKSRNDERTTRIKWENGKKKKHEDPSDKCQPLCLLW